MQRFLCGALPHPCFLPGLQEQTHVTGKLFFVKYFFSRLYKAPFWGCSYFLQHFHFFFLQLKFSFILHQYCFFFFCAKSVKLKPCRRRPHPHPTPTPHPPPSQGIGKFIALDFAQRGARVILACRSESRGAAAVNEIREKSGNPDVHLRLLDLSSLDSVREFTKKILEEEQALHILVNNAAISGNHQWGGPGTTF